MKGAKQLRELLEKEPILAIPGVYDCFSAKVVEKMGFSSAYMTGYGVEASKIGRPDMGFATMTEVIDAARSITNTIDIPLISDADTGYGGIFNVMRTVQLFEQAGVAAIHLEDQVLPKKCGGLSGKVNVPPAEMVAKLKAAQEARENPDFVIIGRTDAKAMGGVDEVKRRLSDYLEAGADLVMIGDRFTVEEMTSIANEFRGKLVISAGFEGCEEMVLPVKQYEEMGVKVIVYAIVGLGAAGKALQGVYGVLQQEGGLNDAALHEHCMDAVAINKTMDIKRFLGIDKQYAEMHKG